MSKALKCDRCGKFYEKNEEHVFEEIFSIRKKPIARVSLTNEDGNLVEEFDLCDDCMGGLLAFLKEKEND